MNPSQAALAVELGGEHPGALVSDEALGTIAGAAQAQTQAALAAREALANSPAGKLMAMTHEQIQGPRGTIWVPKDDISRDLVDAKDPDGNDVLAKLSRQVLEGYDLDLRSRQDWVTRSSTAMDLALQVTENKTFPWDKAANVKLPLITSAAIQFHARAYPAIVPNTQIVKGVPLGPDPEGTKTERADRIGKHLSFQALEEMPEWEEGVDKLLLNVAIVGCAFRKTYFDRTVGANRSDMVLAKNLVVNHRTKSLVDARRVSEELDLYENDVIERQRSGQFRDVDLSLKRSTEDDDPTHAFIEQHTWYDLDYDGYREPYICTVHKESKQVVRIVARFETEGIVVDPQGKIVKIKPEHYYTKFAFIPNPDGGFYDIGIGYLLQPLTESANTIMNQMLDAGTLANMGGGFIGSGLRLRSGPIRIAPGEYLPVNAKGASIKENLIPLTFPGPSTVLFQLLGLMIEMSKEVASVKDVLTGQSVPANQPATTTLALIDQGLKVFTAIYKRLHRSLKQEFQKLYRLNGLFLDPTAYFRFQDQPIEVLQADYQAGDMDVVPITDPSIVAGPVKLIKAQALLGLVGRGLDDKEIYRRYLSALEEPQIEKIVPPPGPLDQIQQMTQLRMQSLALENLSAEIGEIYASVDNKIADSIKKLVDSQLAAVNGQIEFYASQVNALSEQPSQGASSEQGTGQETAPGAAATV